MRRVLSTLVVTGAVLLTSAAWAGNNGKGPNKPTPFGQAGDGNPQYKWRAAEDSVEKNSNQVLLTNPNNVCENPISAAPGRNPHCPAGVRPLRSRPFGLSEPSQTDIREGQAPDRCYHAASGA
jgi:hypothetical protein